MKHFLTALSLLLYAGKSHAQNNATTVLTTLSGFVDQYNKPFKSSGQTELIIFYVAGIEDPLSLVFDKLKDKKVVKGKSVQLVASLEKMLGPKPSSRGLKHIQSGVRDKYGSEYFSILLDATGSLSKQLKMNGLFILTIDQKNNTVKFNDFGTDRKNFLASLKEIYK